MTCILLGKSVNNIKKGDEVEFDFISKEVSLHTSVKGEIMNWNEIKLRGSKHYKNNPGEVEPIDLFKAVTPHASLSALDVKALTDTIKYAYRMLKDGANQKDCDKVQHYIDMVKCCMNEIETCLPGHFVHRIKGDE